MSKSILILSKGETASSTRYRALQYFPNFINAGWTPQHLTISGGFLAIANALIAANKSDVVLLLRKTFPYPIFWLLRHASKKLVFDYDDAIFCNTDGSPSKTRMKRFRKTISASDFVFSGNQYLLKQALKDTTNAIIVPTSINIEKYNINIKKPSQFIDIVWIGSRSTSKYIKDILPALEMAAIKVPNLRLKVIADFSLNSNTLNILPVAWSSATEATELATSHIAIAPLRNDNWSKGKCALKVLQYMAAGLPVISSKSGMNADVVIDGETGFFASNDEEWSTYIQHLASNVGMREKLGKAGKGVVKMYSLDNIFLSKISSVIDINN